jgi:hypothetical protein
VKNKHGSWTRGEPEDGTEIQSQRAKWLPRQTKEEFGLLCKDFNGIYNISDADNITGNAKILRPIPTTNRNDPITQFCQEKVTMKMLWSIRCVS